MLGDLVEALVLDRDQWLLDAVDDALLDGGVDFLERDGGGIGAERTDRFDIGGNAGGADLAALQIIEAVGGLGHQELAETVEGRADDAEAGILGDRLDDLLADRAAPDAEEVVLVTVEIGDAFGIRRRMERAKVADALIHAFEHAALHLLDHLVDGAQMRTREQLDRDVAAEIGLDLLLEDLHGLRVRAVVGACAADADGDAGLGRGGGDGGDTDGRQKCLQHAAFPSVVLLVPAGRVRVLTGPALRSSVAGRRQFKKTILDY